MTTYILLRKNKEHGPYSLDELKAQEIFANDLFWLEGQSACWLNPADIKELKDLVGQPTEKTGSDLSAYLPPEKEVEQVPAPIAVPVPDTIPTVQEKPVASPLPKKEIPLSKPILFPEEDDPAEPETKYSKPLDEIKALYLKNLERQQKRNQFSFTIPPAVKKFLPYAAFLIIGLLVGILINRKGGKTQQPDNIAKQEPVTRPAIPETEEITADPSDGTVIPAASNVAINNHNPEPVYNEPPPDPDPAPVMVKKSAAKKPSIAEHTDDQNGSVSKPDERTARRNEPTPDPDENVGVDLRSLVKVSTNDYEVGSFGGIKNLQLTVTNDSKQQLDQVTAELTYYKPGDELLKKESYHFYGVPARGMQVIAVPKSARGVKVTCKLVRIEANQP